MRVWETSIFYGMIGLVVGVIMMSLERQQVWWRRWMQFVISVLLWPLFAPLTLRHTLQSPAVVEAETAITLRAPSLQLAGQRLWTALAQLKGVAEEILRPEQENVRSLLHKLALMEQRWEEMNHFLNSPDGHVEQARQTLQQFTQQGVAPDDPRIQSIQARIQNIEKVRLLRDHTQQELERAQLKMEEVSSQLVLLRFAERSESEVIAQLRDLTSCVQGVTESLETT